MKNWLLFALVSVLGSAVFVPHASADGSTGAHQLLTPSERVRINESKVRDNPALRGRWTPKSMQPASEEAFQVDNLSQKILSGFRQDPQLSELPMRLKISSKNGVVTLEGAARKRSDIELVEARVRRMPGVKEVRNHIQQKSSDKELLGS